MMLESVASESCPNCGGTLEQYAVDQDALFVHGGYGATSRTVVAHCPGCGWYLQRELSEVRPPRLTT